MYKLHEELIEYPQEALTFILGHGARIKITRGNLSSEIDVHWFVGPREYHFWDNIPAKEFGTYAEQLTFINNCIMAAVELRLRYEKEGV